MNTAPDPLFATIRIPLHSMLKPDVLDGLLSYAASQRKSTDAVVVDALEAFVASLPQTSGPAPLPPEPAKAA